MGGGGGGGNTDELTALKALDIMLRKYDRRSTPTNEQGEEAGDQTYLETYSSKAMESGTGLDMWKLVSKI